MKGIKGILLGLVLMTISCSSVPVYAQQFEFYKSFTESSLRSPNIEWRYKTESGKLYRCLYDYTNQCWIGDWELVM